MKVALGLYTTLYSAPSSLFDRTLSLVYEPILSYLYNKPGNHLALYQSSKMLKHLKRDRQEYKTLIAMCMKRGDIEPMTGAWSESVLSLLPPKDRGSQIEKFTSEIRHEYGVLPQAAFFYGEVWQPNYITLLNNAGIDNVVISTCNENSCREKSPFVMNELGKRVNIFPICDSVSLAVRDYSEGKIDYQTLRSRILSIIHENGESGGVIFLNVDQLVLGAVREAKGNRPGSLICDIFDRFQTSPLSSLSAQSNGYLPQGWYGRDSVTYSLSAVNSLFVKNAPMRYLYNRYITLAESGQLRNNRFLKKDVTTALFNTSLGNLFIHDSELSPLRYSSHREFWQAIIDAESCFRRYTDGPSVKEYDYEESGYPSLVMSNDAYLAVVSPLGGSVSEFDYLPVGINYFDTRTPFDENDYSAPLRKSFEDAVLLSDGEWGMEKTVFTPELVSKKRSEVLLTSTDDSLPFIMTKNYKLKMNTFTLDTTIFARDKKLEGSYRVSIYLTFPDGVLLLPEQRMDMVAKGSVEAKTVKYGSKESESSLVISSVRTFTLTEENETRRYDTALGEEEFVLYKKITFEFPLEVSSDVPVTYRLNIRVISNK